jgi:hypothetical protein
MIAIVAVSLIFGLRSYEHYKEQHEISPEFMADIRSHHGETAP